MYWFELIVGSGVFSQQVMASLVKALDELMAFLTTIVKNEKGKQ